MRVRASPSRFHRREVFLPHLSAEPAALPQTPAPHQAHRRRTKAKFLRLRIAAPVEPDSPPGLLEWRFLCAVPRLAPTTGSPHSRWRSAEQMPLHPATRAKLAARSKRPPLAMENSRSCDSLGQSCASSEPYVPHTIAPRLPVRPAPVPWIRQASRGPANSSYVNRDRRALLGRAATPSRPAADLALLAEIENSWASRR